MKKGILMLAILFAVAVSAAQAQFAPAANEVNPLKVGQAMPDVSLTDGDGNTKTLHSVIGGKPMLLMFYRGDWCGNCIRHFAGEIVPLLPHIAGLGYNVAFISPDDAEHIRITAGKIGTSPSMMLSDSAGELSVPVGIAWQQQERLLPILAEHSGKKNPGFVPVISTFVVDGEGKILFEDIRPAAIAADARIRGKLLAAVLENLM